MIWNWGMRAGLRATMFGATALSATLTGGHAVAAADAASSVQLEQIIVTAEKRETNIQSTPLAITAISGDTLKGQGPVTVETLALTSPSLEFGQSDGVAQVTIRGVGSEQLTLGAEGRAAVHLDGVYLPSLAGVYGSYYDLERVEIVRGPQGDLYGRNATAGALNIITRKPSFTPSGYVQLTGGNFGLVEVQGAVGGGLSDSLAMRIAADVVQRDGYGHDITLNRDINDKKTRAIRGELLYRPNDRFEVVFTADWFKEDDATSALRMDARGYNYAGNPQGFGITQIPYGFSPVAFNGSTPGATSPTTPPNSWIALHGPAGAPAADINDIAADQIPAWLNTNYGFNLTGRYRLTDTLTVKSITGLRRNEFLDVVPTSSTNVPAQLFGYGERSTTWSEELQLLGEFGRDHLVAGLYYLDNRLHAFNEAAAPKFYLAQSSNPFDPQLIDYFRNAGALEVKSYAAFLNNVFDVTPQLSLTLGLRYTHDKIEIANDPLFINFGSTLVHTGFPWKPPGVTPLAAMDKSQSNVSPRMTLTWKPEAGTIVYATYSKGFKSGGFNLGSSQPPFAPETLTDYEAGLKRDWLDGRLRTNLAAFYYDYKNLQVSVTIPLIGAQVRNAASAKAYGLEGDFEAVLTDRLKATAAFALLHTEYVNFLVRDENRITIGSPASCAAGVCTQDVKGNELDKAPPYKITLGLDYRTDAFGGVVTAHGDVTFVDRMYFTAFNQENVSAPPNTTINAQLRYRAPNGAWGELWVRNLTDKQVLENAYVFGRTAGSPIAQTWTPPRTFGVTVGYDF